MGWLIYTGSGVPHDGVERLPEPPPWRVMRGGPPSDTPDDAMLDGELHQAKAYQPDQQTIELVNAAMYLRRPLLVTGRPGTGKSTLAYAIARELRLGPVLHWPITSRATVKDGLYEYDPLARLYAARQEPTHTEAGNPDGPVDDIGNYLRLGPLGTALLPYRRPRVLLIDEIDKSDIDLPNDLLTIFEKGEYDISELKRIADARPECDVPISGSAGRVTITGGMVRCRAFPIVIMTSNREREFPPAFLRRCVSLHLKEPDANQLTKIVRAHLGGLADNGADLIRRFLDRRSVGDLATDQLLNAIYLVHQAGRAAGGDQPIDRQALADEVFAYLSEHTDNADTEADWSSV